MYHLWNLGGLNPSFPVIWGFSPHSPYVEPPLVIALLIIVIFIVVLMWKFGWLDTMLQRSVKRTAWSWLQASCPPTRLNNYDHCIYALLPNMYAPIHTHSRVYIMYQINIMYIIYNAYYSIEAGLPLAPVKLIGLQCNTIEHLYRA